MGPLKKGFDLLHTYQFEEAEDYFCTTITIFREGTESHNHSLYGKARALIGIGQNMAQAEVILCKLIATSPSWVLPYLTLADFYESNQRINEADALYLSALNNTLRTPFLLLRYQGFLRTHFTPWDHPHSFAPLYAATLQQAAAPTPELVTISLPRDRFTPG